MCNQKKGDVAMSRKYFPNISKVRLIQLQKQFKTDPGIAAALGVGPWTVCKWRKRWNIPALGNQGDPLISKISKTQFLKLQKEYGSDTDIAAALGVRTATVWKWRQTWDIPTLGKRGRKPNAIKMLKAESMTKTQFLSLQEKFKTDSAIGKALGVSSLAVLAWRKRWGIPAIENDGDKSKTPAALKAKLVKLQKELRTDAAIAEKLGVSRRTVNSWRKELDIPTLENRGGKPKILISSKAQFLELQKKFRTDSAIGEELGVSRKTVMEWRLKRGIPSLFRKK